MVLFTPNACLALRRKHVRMRVKGDPKEDPVSRAAVSCPGWAPLPQCHFVCECLVPGCGQGLRRMLLFGFQADARTLQEIPAVGQVPQDLTALLESTCPTDARLPAWLPAVRLHAQGLPTACQKSETTVPVVVCFRACH